MAIFEKTEDTYPPRKIIKINNNGNAIVVTAGKSLKLETSPDGQEFVSEVCPEGKTWSVVIFCIITETDA